MINSELQLWSLFLSARFVRRIMKFGFFRADTDSLVINYTEN